MAWTTPKKASDLKRTLTDVAALSDTDTSTRRQLFRKLQKGWDERDYALATANLRIKVLEARIERLQPQKRRKVKLSPNSKFASIKDIRRGRTEASEDKESENSESTASSTLESDSEASTQEGDCIIVGVR